MSYQVLARKWRPAKFAELVGQDHVKSALINGLTNQRLHHAYLFTGTRGVGKTTIARIFAKSLNCETGISAEPCGECGTCIDVDQGRFVDLIEIDAASRTKVGDTREILDNVQYAPTRGRYKVYLIDEVHMLSRHSFNALLKTLEEPPEHVKFLLATTDPQKLPVTILSRCLQFNLQALTLEQISQQLTMILDAEQLPYQVEAIKLLAKYAKGSMRDGLSLTDQAIAQSGQNIQLSSVQKMMGTVDVSWSQNLFGAILQSDSEKLVAEFERLTKQNPDVERVLDDLLMVCHQIALTQVLPSAAKLNEINAEFIEAVARQVSPQEIQVYYQILLQGKRDLKIAADLISGFEMVCLRMLAFNPVSNYEQSETDIKKNSELSLPEPLLHKEPEPETQNVKADEDVLLAQQAFYQDMADSQGFSSQNSNDLENQTIHSETFSHDETSIKEKELKESLVPNELTPTVESTEETNNSNQSFSAMDNPVLAILAARGLNTDQPMTQIESAFKPEVSVAPEPVVQPQTEIIPESELKQIDHEDVRFAHEVDQWASIIEQSGLAGLTRQLALHSAPEITGTHIELTVKKDFAHLLNDKTETELYEVVNRLAPECDFLINKSEIAMASPAAIQQNINQNRQQRAEQSIEQDPLVQTLVQEFEGKVIPESIKPL